MTDKLKIKFSSTALGHAACMREFFWTVVGSIDWDTMTINGGYKQLPTDKLVYGVAIHKFLDLMYKSDGDMVSSMFEALKSFDVEKVHDKKSPHLSDRNHFVTTANLVWNMVSTDREYKILKADNIPLTELTFSHHLHTDSLCEIYLEGTLDKIGQIVNGCYAIGDWKTTSTWDKKNYFTKYILSRQLRVYALALKLEADKNPDSVLGKIGSTSVGAFIDAIFLKPSAHEVEVTRSDVYQYTNQELKMFYEQIKQFAERFANELQIMHQRRADGFSLDRDGLLNGTCEKKYGFCNFLHTCSNAENIGRMLLQRDFKQVIFNPLNYNGAE